MTTDDPGGTQPMETAFEASRNEPHSPIQPLIKSPYDPNPRALCPDPQLGTRAGWIWCADCCGIQSPPHVCNRVRV